MKQGYFSLVLHAHLPYVRHPEFDTFLEEDWLFEAITETYLPLLNMMETLQKDNVHFRLTISLTPTLLAMLGDDVLKLKYITYLNDLIQLVESENIRTRFNEKLQLVSKMYLKHLKKCLQAYLTNYGCDIISQFKKFLDLGKIDILTSAATHGYLPLLKMNQKSVYAQLKTGIDDYVRYFGVKPKGIWLPECGYVPGFDLILKNLGIEYFFLDAHGLIYGDPRPTFGNYAPIKCESGIHAFARDLETSKMVWSQEHGYPGDSYYREFYRDIGHELDYHHLKPFLKDGDVRKNTGIKYYRITDRNSSEKMIYEPHIARQRAIEHAKHFVSSRLSQAISLKKEMKKKPIIVSTYDAELFGHWWYEGVIFIEHLFRSLDNSKETLLSITPKEYLKMFPVNQQIKPTQSSWGDKGYHEFWLNESNDWLYKHLYEASLRMEELASKYKGINGVLKRALNQSARELLLVQSSDWSFILKTGTTVEYAVKRFKNHLARFFKLYDDITSNQIDEVWLKDVEFRDNIFPEIDFNIFSN